MLVFTSIGLAATTLAGFCLYAASPNQRLWASSWPRRPACMVGTGLLALGWLAFAQDMRHLAATFTFVTTLMLVLAMLPYLGAWCHARRAH